MSCRLKNRYLSPASLSPMTPLVERTMSRPMHSSVSTTAASHQSMGPMGWASGPRAPVRAVFREEARDVPDAELMSGEVVI